MPKNNVTPRERAINTVNAIRSQASEQYQSAIPRFEAGADYNSAMQSIVQYAPFYNEFVSGLVNRIMFTQIQRASFNNPLQVLHRGGYPLGTDVQNVYTNPANPKAYNMNSGATGLFENAPATTIVQYFRRNRQDKYKLTINREVLAGGFRSWEDLDAFIQSQMASIYSGMTIDEYNLMKKVFAEGVQEEAIVTDQTITYTPGTEQSALDLAAKLRTYYGQFRFPSYNFNKYQAYAQAHGVTGAPAAKTWVEGDDVLTIIRSDVLTDIDMYVEAQAYNIDKSKLLGQVIEVDNFNYFAGNPNAYEEGTENTDMEDCLAIILDRKAVQVFNNLQMAGDFFNPDDLMHHYYMHVWQTYVLNLTANCVAIMKKA